MSNLFGTVGAFFAGFSTISRSFAGAKLRQHGIRLVAALLLVTYYAVQAYYFFHHSADVPREKISDRMSMLFQAALAPVFFMGFQGLVKFILRDDVQAAYVRVEAALRRRTLWTLRTVWTLARRSVVCSLKLVRSVARLGVLLARGLMLIMRRGAGALARLLARQGRHVRAFARTCVEAGTNAR